MRRCRGWDLQASLLFGNLVAAVLHLAYTVDPFSMEGLLSPAASLTLVVFATLSSVIVAAMVLRLFAQIYSRIHPPSKRVLKALDAACVIVLLIAIVFAISRTTLSESDAFVIEAVLLIVLIVFVLATVVGSIVYVSLVIRSPDTAVARPGVKDPENDAKRRLLTVIVTFQLVGLVTVALLIWAAADSQKVQNSQDFSPFFTWAVLTRTIPLVECICVLLVMGKVGDARAKSFAIPRAKVHSPVQSSLFNTLSHNQFRTAMAQTGQGALLVSSPRSSICEDMSLRQNGRDSAQPHLHTWPTSTKANSFAPQGARSPNALSQVSATNPFPPLLHLVSKRIHPEPIPQTPATLSIATDFKAPSTVITVQ